MLDVGRLGMSTLNEVPPAMRLPRIASRLLAAYTVAAVGVVASCLIWFVFPEEAIGLVPAPALRLIPLDIRPLRYRTTVRACFPGWAQGYEASDGGLIAASGPVPASWLDDLAQSASDAPSIVFRQPLTDERGAPIGERLLVRVVGPAPGSEHYVLCVLGDSHSLLVSGPTERHVLDVERIERGDRSLVRRWPFPAPPN